ncbi:MAG: PEGA domain-containing protein [Chloroflexota bacterium]|nr:PEGA domain-containing protein [Chloroflexota bacterium]
MIKLLRIAPVFLLAVAASLSLNAASAQMMHFTLNVVIETEDGSEIPAGEVCVSGEVDPICQDTGGNPSGREFSFTGLADGDHEVTVNAGDYLEIVDTVTLTENETTITLTLEMEQTAPPASELPDTGSGPVAEASATSSTLLIAGGFALILAAFGLVLHRREG